jgi:hypothetical protein
MFKHLKSFIRRPVPFREREVIELFFRENDHCAVNVSVVLQ